MQGDEFLVEVEASDDALGGLHTVLEGTTLDIHPGAGSRRFFGLFATDYEVRVTLPELKSLTASRGAEVDGAYTLTGGTLALIARSGSEFDLAIDVASIEIEVSGGSDMDLSGTAGTSTIHVRGGSEFSGGDFIAEDVTVDISGGSEAFLTVTNRITGSASGGSVLVYQGNPVTVEVSSSRNASVVRR
jgi:hypothetical protein